MHRLYLGFYCHLTEFYGMESEPILTPREKSPLPEAQKRVEPVMLHHAGQQAKHTANKAIQSPNNGYEVAYLFVSSLLIAPEICRVYLRNRSA